MKREGKMETILKYAGGSRISGENADCPCYFCGRKIKPMTKRPPKRENYHMKIICGCLLKHEEIVLSWAEMCKVCSNKYNKLFRSFQASRKRIRRSK